MLSALKREPVMFGRSPVPPCRYMCVQKITRNGKQKTLIADADTRAQVIIYMLDLLDEHGIRATPERIEDVDSSIEVA